MKAKEVLKLLNISRITLYNYVKSRKITVRKRDNGYYDYDNESVYKLLKEDNRKIILYARVSTYKQKNDLDNQVSQLVDYCKANNIMYSKIYREISSGIDLDRNQLNILIDDVIHYKVKSIYITHNDRLTRLSFRTLNNIFKRFHTEIISINNNNNEVYDEVFEELVSLIHIYSTRIYSHRQNKFKKKNKII